MVAVYTVCTINYLAHAQAFFESFRIHHPTVPYLVGLVDKSKGRLESNRFPFEIVEVEQAGVPVLANMADKYTILELTCALKPFFASYFFDAHPDVSELWYFDTDILIYHPMVIISEKLQTADILITPHFLSPIQDHKRQSERDFLNSGLYNAGFFALKRSPETDTFLSWWQDRASHEGYLRFDLGMFLDQLWLNFVPIFFNKVDVERHPGLNVGYWNLHEREISYREGSYWINGTYPLYFYHFSGFNPEASAVISRHQNRWSYKSRADIVPLYQQYAQSLEKFDYGTMSRQRSWYDKKYKPRSLYERLVNLSKRRTSYLLWKLIRIVEPNPQL
jgi:hypothetical protein